MVTLLLTSTLKQWKLRKTPQRLLRLPVNNTGVLTPQLERLQQQSELVWRRYDARHTGVLLSQNTQYHEDTNTANVVQE